MCFEFVSPSFVGAIIGSLLIIFNDQWKRFKDNRERKQKYQLWKEIFDSVHESGKIIETEKIVEEYHGLIYELLKDGLIELEASGNYFKVKREQLS